MKGFTYGFDTGFDTLPHISKECRNLLSTRRSSNHQIVTDLVKRELDRGYLIGPFPESPFTTHRVNPLGLVQGKYSKKHRLIVDLSAPHDDEDHASLNSLIDKEKFSLTYVRIDDAVRIIKALGRGSFLCKTDITDAFKLIPIHPSLWHLHGVKWNQSFYYYTRLVFGSRSSPRIFDDFSSIICWIAQTQYQIDNILHLLDDFICFDRYQEQAEGTMTRLLQMFADLGSPWLHIRQLVPPHDLSIWGSPWILAQWSSACRWRKSTGFHLSSSHSYCEPA